MEDITNITQKKLSDWVHKVIETGSWKEYNDLHIDELDEISDSSKMPIEIGTAALKFCKSLIDVNYDVILAIAFSNKTNKFLQPFSINELEELLESPPSLYVFEKKWPAWVETLQEAKPCKIKELATYSCFFRELKDLEEPSISGIIYIF